MIYIITFAVALFLASFGIVSAHEAYVLPYNTFWEGIDKPGSAAPFTEIAKNSHDIHIGLTIAISVIVLLVLNFFFRQTRFAKKVGDWFESFAHVGPHFVRITLAVAFFFSAQSSTFLGPELRESLLPHPHLVQIALFAMSAMIAIGFLTEIAALAGIVLFFIGFHVFGSYMFTYFNYLGELIVLLFFGMRVFSLDKYIFGPLRRFKNFEKWEIVIVRIMYGFALLYAAINVKLLHPDVTTAVVTGWHLTKFHLLFPSDPVLVTFGAGIVEAVIGIFIIFGFQMRLTVFVSLFYITLSLLYFRELVWPHLLLYGISFNLIVQPETFTLDSFFDKFFAKRRARLKA